MWSGEQGHAGMSGEPLTEFQGISVFFGGPIGGAFTQGVSGVWAEKVSAQFQILFHRLQFDIYFY